MLCTWCVYGTRAEAPVKRTASQIIQHSDDLIQTCVASVGAVAMQASFVGLPDLPCAVLKDILEQVSLLDRLTCEQVCRSWRQAMRTPKLGLLYTVHNCQYFSPTVQAYQTQTSSALRPPCCSSQCPVCSRCPHFFLVLVFGWLAAGQPYHTSAS